MLRELAFSVAAGVPLGVGVATIPTAPAPVVTEAEIPAVTVGYYRAGAAAAPCPLRWEHLAGIGKIETNHARWEGAEVLPTGEVVPHIYGPYLDGRSAAIGLVWTVDPVTGQRVHDRGGGPMAFITAAWEQFGTDASGDGVKDRHNIVDAMGAAAALLCHNGYDIADPAKVRTAIRRYNGSGPAAEIYADKVLAYAATLDPDMAGTTTITPAGDRSFVEAIDRKAVEGWMVAGDYTTRHPVVRDRWEQADTWLFDTADTTNNGPAPAGNTSGVPVAQTDRVDPVFRARLAAMMDERPGITINNDFRSHEVQAQLWEQALRKYGSPEAAGKWVAPPGRSNHGRGLAADLTWASDADRVWAHENAARFRLCFPMSWEPWHIQPVETC